MIQEEPVKKFFALLGLLGSKGVSFYLASKAKKKK